MRLLLIVLVIGGVLMADEAADRIVVNKARREMFLYQDGKVLRSYKIMLGRTPVGPKMQEGDGKTPEGAYTISGRNPKSAYHLSLRVSYPTAEQKEAARKLGVSAGGDIMIHGLPNGAEGDGREYVGRDWTEGCISVTDAEIEEIWRLVPNGIPIEINP